MDASRFGNLSLKDGVVKFTMIGTPEDQTFRDLARETDNTVSLRAESGADERWMTLM